MITWLYMEYRLRMEREGHTFKIHIIQVWSMLTSTLQSCCQVFLITCKLLGLLWITRSVRWWLTLMFNVICWRSQWFEVLDGLLGRKWKFLGLGFNCVYLLFSAITQLIACGRYLPIRASMSTFMHVLISLWVKQRWPHREFLSILEGNKHWLYFASSTTQIDYVLWFPDHSNIFLLNNDLNKREWTYIFGACCLVTIFIPSFRNYRLWSFFGVVTITYTSWYMTVAALFYGQVPINSSFMPSLCNDSLILHARLRGLLE